MPEPLPLRNKVQLVSLSLLEYDVSDKYEHAKRICSATFDSTAGQEEGDEGGRAERARES